jgi:glutamyl endopeptidase
MRRLVTRSAALMVAFGPAVAVAKSLISPLLPAANARREAKRARSLIRSALLGVLLFTHQATGDEAGGRPNTPVYSDPTIVVPPIRSSAEEASDLNQPSKGRAEAVLESRLQESPAEFQALLERQPAMAPVGAENILGCDDRLRWYTGSCPARALVLITYDRGGFPFLCSGVLIGWDTVLTAGHCVHSGGGGGVWSTNVVVYPGRDGASAPYGSCGASWLASVGGWVSNADERYDYGVIKLDCDVGNAVGWFGFWWQDTSLKNLPTIVSGYPGDKPLELWAAFDQVRVCQTLQTFYKADTIGGVSGSPAWQPRPAGSSGCANGPCVHSIHGYGIHGITGAHSSHNHGARITKAVFNNLVTWKSAAK